MKTGYSILMVAPGATEARLAGKILRSQRPAVTLECVKTKTAFAAALRRHRPDLVLFDLATPEFDASAALRLIRDSTPDLPFILLASPEEKRKLSRELKESASDIVLKKRPTDLLGAVRRVLDAKRQKNEAVDSDGTSHRNQELLRLLIEHVTDYAIYVLDAHGMVTSWNEGAEGMTGYSAKEALHRHLNHCFTRVEVKQGKPANELRTALEKGTIQSEGWCRRKDGSTYYAQWTITALRDGSGKPAGFLKLARDITERQQHANAIAKMNADLEQRVRERTAQLEDANQELEAFSYSVSHDLRAPLRHIDGFIEILQENAATKLDPESREHLQTIAQAARQMGRLIDALLAFSRLARAQVNKRRLDLNLVLRDVLGALKGEIRHRKIQWIIHKLPVVDADPVLFKQVMLNLVSNAVKYTRKRPRAIIEIGTGSNRREHVIFVRDNGVGFDMAHSDKLFGAFQRLHRASEFEGTGVGLANVRRIIHRHGGRVWAEGIVDTGAIFYFSLPKKKKEAA
ncbi:MAG TPA: ATP-binding protein [Verrucomicrobiae bacterium]|nr:ATP-binding protein [Verrucomicrobiae bacterium]